MRLRRQTDGPNQPDNPQDKAEEAVLGPGTDCDADWRERIALAKQIREESKRARAGRPVTFRMSGTLHVAGAYTENNG